MPVVQIQMVAGRTPEQKRALIQEVTDAVVRAIEAPRQSVRVILIEVPPEHFAVGGVSKAEQNAARSPGLQGDPSTGM
jgi:4-oxalocrotonate tautomerase